MSYDVYVSDPEDPGFSGPMGENYTWNMGYAICAGGIRMYRPRGMDPERVTDDDGLFILDGAPCPEAAEALTKCVRYVCENKSDLEAQEPPNGWGSVDNLLKFLGTITRVCLDHPTRRVYVT